MATRPSDPDRPRESRGGAAPSLWETVKLLALVTFLVTILLLTERIATRIWPEPAEVPDTRTTEQGVA